MSNGKILAFGCDYSAVRFLEAPFDEKLTKKLYSCDLDNSNFCQGDLGDYVFVFSRTGVNFWQAHAENFKFPLFSLKKEITGHWRIDFYSSFFHWEHWRGVIMYLAKFSHKVLRVDIAVDIVVYLADLINCVDTVLPKINWYGETYYYGRFSSKRRRLRIYNKLLDCEVKRKRELFYKYFDYPNVTRVEIELRSRGCVERLLNNLLKIEDDEFLFDVFMTETQNKFFWLDIGLKKPRSRIRWDTKKKGPTDASLRFLQACILAHKKGVDIQEQVNVFLKR